MGWPRMARRAAELGALELQIATANLESILHVASRTFAVAADQSISDWAERNRILPKGTTPRPGPFRAEAFQRGILDSVRMRRTKKVVCLKSTQIGWTDAILLNMIAYFIAVDPKPIML